MKKLICSIIIITLIGLSNGCSQLSEDYNDIGMELLTMELNDADFWWYRDFEPPCEYFKWYQTLTTYLPSLDQWRFTGNKQYIFPISYNQIECIDEQLESLKDIEGLVSRSEEDMFYKKGNTFLKYLKNDNLISSVNSDPDSKYVATLDFDIPPKYDDIIGTDLEAKLFLEEDGISSYEDYGRYSGNYVKYALAITKNRDYLEERDRSCFKPLAKLLSDKVISDKYPDTMSRTLNKDSIDRNEYVEALTTYLYEQYSTFLPSSCGEGLIVEKGFLRFNNDWTNPIIYVCLNREEFKYGHINTTDTFKNFMEDAVKDDATFTCTLTDIDSSWAKDAITELASLNAINGFTDHTYKPNNNMHLAEFITMFTKVFYSELLETETTSGKILRRISEDNIIAGIEKWWTECFLIGSNYLIKDSDIQYYYLMHMDKQMERQEMAYMVANHLKLDLQQFTTTAIDINKADTQYRSHINACMSAGVIVGTGNGKFNPTGIVTRAEAAQVILNVINYNK
ncbi:hypothetical protein SH1V18_11290 [Vallitalea longa]|uniref:SLH domain-containing protein n=1 Tax=Vallitalea longa TaxID=2936439 RepID=A0A9W5Y8U1_9FIRM|nr:S-layer homology domain-containing protein [Vallitalea longa]GKX28649.1 hypothetical protein SH1V18_11290 [Vallitalea longa]